MSFSISRPVDVKIVLFKWSSEEFPQEIALIYTSQSNASRTSTSRFCANRHKVLFTLYDCLCEGNPVRVDMVFKVERDDKGDFKIGTPTLDFSGHFSERRLKPDEKHLSYQDQFGERKALFSAYSSGDELVIAQLLFSCGEKILVYFYKIRCDPKNGLEVELRGPFGFKDSSEDKLGGIYIELVVTGKPTSVSYKDETGVAVSHGKQVRPPLILPPRANSLFTKREGNAFSNRGNVNGHFNGSNVNVTVNYHRRH